MEDNAVLNLSEAASYLRLCTKSVRSLIKKGKIPVLRSVRDVRVRRADLEKLFEIDRKEGKSL